MKKKLVICYEVCICDEFLEFNKLKNISFVYWLWKKYPYVEHGMFLW